MLFKSIILPNGVTATHWIVDNVAIDFTYNMCLLSISGYISKEAQSSGIQAIDKRSLSIALPTQLDFTICPSDSVSNAVNALFESLLQTTPDFLDAVHV
jgi:hypothetical protein